MEASQTSSATVLGSLDARDASLTRPSDGAERERLVRVVGLHTDADELDPRTHAEEVERGRAAGIQTDRASVA
jgi:hypothetical protein